MASYPGWCTSHKLDLKGRSAQIVVWVGYVGTHLLAYQQQKESQALSCCRTRCIRVRPQFVDIAHVTLSPMPLDIEVSRSALLMHRNPDRADSVQIVYEFLLRYVVSNDTDAKTAKKYIDQHFVVGATEHQHNLRQPTSFYPLYRAPLSCAAPLVPCALLPWCPVHCAPACTGTMHSFLLQVASVCRLCAIAGEDP